MLLFFSLLNLHYVSILAFMYATINLLELMKPLKLLDVKSNNHKFLIFICIALTNTNARIDIVIFYIIIDDYVV